MTRYKQIVIDGKWRPLHRYIVECAIGRRLTRAEVVHHINGDHRDNRLENLEVLSCREHAITHNQKHLVTKACEVCGVEYEPHPTKRARSRTCSRDCFRKLSSRLAIERANRPGAFEKSRAAAIANGSAARAPNMILARWHPKPWLCYVCGEPATCFGKYDGATRGSFGCDRHCGHGQEGGSCRQLFPSP